MFLYDPNQSGHGLSLEKVGAGHAGAWYCFDGNGNQMWLILTPEGNLHRPDTSLPGFPMEGKSEVGPVVGTYTLSETEGKWSMTYTIETAATYPAGQIHFSPPPPPSMSGTLELVRLL